MAGMLQYGPVVIFAYAILYIYIYSYIGCIRPADLNISKHQEIKYGYNPLIIYTSMYITFWKWKRTGKSHELSSI